LGKFGLDIRKRLFTKTAAARQNRLPREAVTAPRQSESQKRPDDAPGHLA